MALTAQDVSHASYCFAHVRHLSDMVDSVSKRHIFPAKLGLLTILGVLARYICRRSDAFAISPITVALQPVHLRVCSHFNVENNRNTSMRYRGIESGFTWLISGAITFSAAQVVSKRNRHCQQVGEVALRAEQSDISQIEFKVGHVVSCERHPDSEKLLVEKVDVGEEAPRQICSGISKFLTPEQMVGRQVVVVANLKGRKMAGVESEGMILCATKRDSVEADEASELALVEAPSGVPPGERIVVEDSSAPHGEAANPSKVQKKKLFEKIAPDLRTDANGTVCYKDSPFMTTAGPCTATSLPSATVS